MPQHLGLGGRVAGEFAARRGPRRLANWAMRWVALAGAVAAGLAARHPFHPHASTVMVLVLMFGAFAFVGLAVRRARITIEAGGVRWGWAWLGVRMERERIRAVDVYADAIAVRPRRGSAWFLSARDWDRFDAMTRAVARAGFAVTVHDRSAPLAARLQSYGRVLDSLMIGAIIGTTILAAAAAAF